MSKRGDREFLYDIIEACRRTRKVKVIKEFFEE